jgi:hypothetical protein
MTSESDTLKDSMTKRKAASKVPKMFAHPVVRQPSVQEHSTYVDALIVEKLSADESLLVQVCRTANQNPEVRKIEDDFDAIGEY